MTMTDLWRSSSLVVKLPKEYIKVKANGSSLGNPRRAGMSVVVHDGAGN